MNHPKLLPNTTALCSITTRRLARWRRLAAALAVASVIAPTAGAGVSVDKTSPRELVAGAVKVQAGELVGYRLVLSGDARRDAYGLRVTETWPEGLEFIDAWANPSAAAVFDPASHELTWFADAPAGATATLDVTARVLPSSMGETLKSDITVSGADALVGEDLPIAVQSSANVDVAVSGSSSRVLAGEFFEISYAMSIVNNGPDPASEVVLEIIIDPVTLDEIETGSFNNVPVGACDVDTLICQFGDLGVGERIDFEAVARVHIDSTPIGITLDFQVSSNDMEIDAANNQIFVNESLPEVESDDGGGALGPVFLLALLAARRRKALTGPKA